MLKIFLFESELIMLKCLYCAGIILTKMRINTEILVDVLEKNPDFKSIIRCKRFVGKGYGDMTDHDQEKILQKFRSNESELRICFNTNDI